MLRFIFVTALALASAFFNPTCAQSGEPALRNGAATQLSRYTTIDSRPEASVSNPLAVIATVSFPRAHVQTVGDAIRHLLARTGYQLVPEEVLDERSRGLLALPLPESHRQLGPYRVDAMLLVLLGDPWKLQIDPLARTVRFAPAPPTPPQTAAAAHS